MTVQQIAAVLVIGIVGGCAAYGAGCMVVLTVERSRRRRRVRRALQPYDRMPNPPADVAIEVPSAYASTTTAAHPRFFKNGVEQFRCAHPERPRCEFFAEPGSPYCYPHLLGVGAVSDRAEPPAAASSTPWRPTTAAAKAVVEEFNRTGQMPDLPPVGSVHERHACEWPVDECGAEGTHMVTVGGMQSRRLCETHMHLMIRNVGMRNVGVTP